MNNQDKPAKKIYTPEELKEIREKALESERKEADRDKSQGLAPVDSSLVDKDIVYTPPRKSAIGGSNVTVFGSIKIKFKVWNKIEKRDDIFNMQQTVFPVTAKPKVGQVLMTSGIVGDKPLETKMSDESLQLAIKNARRKVVGIVDGKPQYSGQKIKRMEESKDG